jgi:hypothetical protein
MAGEYWFTSISNDVRTVGHNVVEDDDVPSVSCTFAAGLSSLPVSASISGDLVTTLISCVTSLTLSWAKSGNHDAGNDHFIRRLLKSSNVKWADNVVECLFKLVEMQQVKCSSDKERVAHVLPVLDELQQMLQAFEKEDFAPFKEVVLHDLALIVEEIRSLA